MKTFTLEELCEILKQRFGEDFLITHRDFSDGRAEAILTVGKVIRAAWRARLIKMPPRDGVTPRGPREYYDLQFFDPI